MAKVYTGCRDADGVRVTVNGKALDPRLDLQTLSSSGFEWGYDGGGPAQLALAILADHLGDGAAALSQYKTLRSGVIAAIRDDEWSLDSATIDRALNGIIEVAMTLDELLDKVRGNR